ncbi:unnamed protein product [Orchesella dallaii]|uniref:Uncharacterized protein n=1 Tax=Orchesella dallaii TaxID=48710 RepID=A0ABP1QZ14_9HEXA
MAFTENFASWQETQIVFLESFRTSTVAFMWGIGDPLTSTVLAQCIILQCILTSFNTSRLEDQISQASEEIHGFRRNWIRELTYTQILKENANTIAQQIYSTHDFILIADTISPNNGWKERTFRPLSVILTTRIPIKMPTAVLLMTPTPGLISPDSVQAPAIFLSSILIFVNLHKNFVYIGCFSCHKNLTYFSQTKQFKPHQSITLECIPKSSAKSFNSIFIYWQSMHSRLFLGYEAPKNNCMTLYFHEKDSIFHEESCQIYEEYFRYSNCSNFEACLLFYMEFLLISPKHSLAVHDSWKIFPFVQNQTDISLQVLFPNIKFFDANLQAYLTPFKLEIWLCVLVSMISILTWLIWMEDQDFYRVALLQFSIILEQGIQLLRTGVKYGNFILTIWIYCSIFLRFFYTSSLYSLLTAEEAPNDYPQNMQQLLNRPDFDLVLTGTFFYIMFWTCSRFDTHPPQQLEKFYVRVLQKAYFMVEEYGTPTMEKILDGNPAKVWYFVEKNKFTTVPALGDSMQKTEYLKFNQFAIMCEATCDETWSVSASFTGQTRLHHVFLKESRFFTSNMFWSEVSPTFVSIQFSKFLGSFVHSGIYELLVVRFRKLNKLKLLKEGAHNFKRVGYSLFSYVFFTSENRDDLLSSIPEATKLSTFAGTFMMAGFLLSIALLVLLIEVVGTESFRKAWRKWNLVAIPTIIGCAGLHRSVNCESSH